MKFNLKKYQKILPVGLLSVFLLGSLLYVVLFYRPTLDMSIKDQPVIKVESRSQAEIEVYKELPYKATFNLTTGESFAMDMRFLGLSYFSENELKRLDAISSKSFWGKFTPFFDTKQKQLISIYPNRMFWLAPLNKTLDSHPELLKQEPTTNYLTVDAEGNLIIADAIPGYQIDKEAFIKAANEITKTGKFNEISLESSALAAESQAETLAQYPNLLQKSEFPLSSEYIPQHNLKTGLQKMQNIYIAAGETLTVSDLLGKLDASSGYLATKDKKGKDVYGLGVEQMIDAIEQLAQAKMSVKSYRGQHFNIGDPAQGLTQLTIENNTANDMVFSLSIEDDKLSVVLASK
ncbi:VanW family protein [Streptococcus oricebi]|uniref:Uncharacterized protein n=1 Tax=Streptococcus oricebi TaxID=1547447 RepID=A0ABS5B6R9_9STRE|nr:VanW family protein [Streptococcus oricebi]MBP2624191.1 hypothetical protein [Streptococcus oricebi]